MGNYYLHSNFNRRGYYLLFMINFELQNASLSTFLTNNNAQIRLAPLSDLFYMWHMRDESEIYGQRQ